MTAETLTPALSVEVFEAEHGDHNVRVTVTTFHPTALVYTCLDCDAKLNLPLVFMTD